MPVSFRIESPENPFRKEQAIHVLINSRMVAFFKFNAQSIQQQQPAPPTASLNLLPDRLQYVFHRQVSFPATR